jgi:hypothetical protein
MALYFRNYPHGAESFMENYKAAQGIPCCLWNLKAHCGFYKRPPLDLILTQMNPVHTLLLIFKH